MWPWSSPEQKLRRLYLHQLRKLEKEAVKNAGFLKLKDIREEIDRVHGVLRDLGVEVGQPARVIPLRRVQEKN
jgi:hypothetical protein